MQPTSFTLLTFWNRITATWARARESSWWEAVWWPFVITRLVWVLAAAFARGTFQPNPTYLKYAQQGGHLTRIFLLDIFTHWDAKFYLSIIQNGYWSQTNLTEAYSNVAFFPLYPYLVKSIGWLGVEVPTGAYLLIGVLLSNLCFLGGASLLYWLARRHLELNEDAARRSLLLVYAYPAGFFFSCFYTEGLFFFLTLLGFAAGLERRWWLAGLAGGLLVLTRFQGAVVVAALGLLYLETRGWRLSAIRADVMWFGLAPLLLGAHLYYLYTLTGDFLAPFTAVNAWERNKYGLMEGLHVQLEAPALDVFKIEAVLALLFLACGVYLLLRRRTVFPKSMAIFTIVMCIIPVSTGLLTSTARYLAVIFPVYLMLGEKLSNSRWFNLLCARWFALQVLYFAGYANYYWIA